MGIKEFVMIPFWRLKEEPAAWTKEKERRDKMGITKIDIISFPFVKESHIG